MGRVISVLAGVLIMAGVLGYVQFGGNQNTESGVAADGTVAEGKPCCGGCAGEGQEEKPCCGGCASEGAEGACCSEGAEGACCSEGAEGACCTKGAEEAVAEEPAAPADEA